ncbi:hypothetical protein BC826DRAFT_923129, partial [Russula brevipes]
RFRQVPTFGRYTVRRFRGDVTAMKRLTGRDFKDILLCVMPVFEDLLPEPYNAIIMTLLFELVQWLSFAKLRQHTETTLTQFQAATTSLGNQVRTFAAKVCPRFETTDTPREAGARARRQAVKATGETSRPSRPGKGKEKETIIKKHRREFNPNTYKFHALGDYTSTIRRFGTIDNYNTQNVSHNVIRRTSNGTLVHRASASTSESRYSTLAQTNTSLYGSVLVMSDENACFEAFMPRKRPRRHRSKMTELLGIYAYPLSRRTHCHKRRLESIFMFLSPDGTVLIFPNSHIHGVMTQRFG